MARALAIAVIALAGFASYRAVATVDIERRCPKLPEASGYVWQYSPGPDFVVCRASRAGAHPATELIGVYMGFAPSFRVEHALLQTDGWIGGVDVHWYQKLPDDPAYKLGLQTLYPLKPGVAHIWLLAQDAQTLASLVRLLGQLQFPQQP